MKVVHLTVLRNLAGGQRKQLRQERIAASALQGVQQDTVAIRDGDSQSEFERRTPTLFRQQPVSMKIQSHQGKSTLRSILYDHVPRGRIKRPKTGFGIPVGQRLRGPMREWAEAMLEGSRLKRECYLAPGPIREAWPQHLSGRHDGAARLSAVLMFQPWLETPS